MNAARFLIFPFSIFTLPEAHTFAAMILFEFLRFWITLAMRFWYRKVYVSYEAPLPEDGPIIFACTHPNSAIDFLFLPLITKKPAHVLVRGDVFEKKWLNKIFRSIWMLPVYRMRDGYGNVSRNDQSFGECYDLFDHHGRVLIFSEGVCVQEKTLQPLKKGTARLALDYMAKGEGRELYIVPMANNYTRFREFRSSVMTNFGKPIKASDYTQLYAENQNQAYVKLTEDITTNLKRNFIEVKDFTDDSETEKALQALRLNRLDERKSWVVEDRSVFEEEKALVEQLNNGAKLSSEWKEAVEEEEIGTEQEGLLKERGKQDVQLMKLFILSFFMGALAVLLYLPWTIARWVVKNRIKDIIFNNTVTIMAGMLIFMLQVLVVLLICVPLFGFQGLVIAASMIAVVIIGTEIVDDYAFAWHNWKRLKHRPLFQRIHDEVRKIMA